MKQKTRQVLAIIALTCVFMVNACDHRIEDQHTKNSETIVQEGKNEGFSCNATNVDGELIHAFCSEVDGVWYLMVPSHWNLSELTLHYIGEVSKTEYGELDQETSSILNAFSKNRDKIVLETGKQDSVTVAVLQSDLPSVQIALDKLTLEEVHADKSRKHPGNSVRITDADGNVNVDVSRSVEIKGRGNSTWQCYEKKGYQIRFSNATDVLGMGKAEKWVLLSNASDDSMLRSYVAYETAKQLAIGFVPDFEYTDLWIDGEYRGTYLIGEKVEIGENRLNLKNPLGTLFERDDAFYAEEEYRLFNNYLGANFVLKENVSDEERLYQAALDDMAAKLDQLMRFLYSTPSAHITFRQLSERIDVDSFAMYYLVNEYVLNRESVSTSFYWYLDGPDDVIHLGPIWDFDTCMGNDGAGNTEYYCCNSLIFKYLLAVPEFYQRTQELYLENKDAFDSMAGTAERYGEKISRSAQANYLRWNVLGSESTKQGGMLMAESYEDAVSSLTTWLSGRTEVFEIPRIRVAVSTVSNDYGTLQIRYLSDQECGPLRFVCWNQSSEDDTVMWYDGVLQDGIWTADANLAFFQEKGMYHFEVYDRNLDECIASGVNYVAGVKMNPYVMETELSEDMNQLIVTIADPQASHESVNFAIWSIENSQDDLQMFRAQKDESGMWKATVDLSEYETEGKYNIHAFGYANTGNELLNVATIVRYRIWTPEENPYLIQTQISEETMTASVTLNLPRDDCSLVNFLIWNTVEGQDDMQLYAAEKTGEGQWSCIVDLTQHAEEGQFTIHAYGEKAYDYIWLNESTFIWYRTSWPDGENPYLLQTEVGENTSDLIITLTVPEDDCSMVHFLVWGSVEGQEDIQVYEAEKIGDGQWGYTVDLTQHAEEGQFNVHAYGVKPYDYIWLNEASFIWYRTFWLEGENPYLLQTKVSKDALNTAITVCVPQDDCSAVHFYVWSSADGQDDIQMYEAEKTADGYWSCTVDLAQHAEEGQYNVHAYGAKPYDYILLNAATFDVIFPQK